MNLRFELLKEHSRNQTIKLSKHIGEDVQRFAELMQIFFHGSAIEVQRASWVLSYCTNAHPNLANPFFSQYVGYLKKTGIHDAVKRNILRLLSFANVPEKLEGRTTEICFQFLLSNDESIATKIYSMSILANISTKHPELKAELKIAIEDQMHFASAGFRSRGKKVLRAIR